VPLYKRLSHSSTANYRALHLTSQVSKVVERILGTHWQQFLHNSGAYGPNQFAYMTKRGYRDALAFVVSSWLAAFGRKKRVALYCADVAGAFDRVKSEKLLERLLAAGVHPLLVDVIRSWLLPRSARVVVDGARSLAFVLLNMVFQGTVWGPALWNLFFSSVRDPVNEVGFIESIFADDLNCFKVLEQALGDDAVLRQLQECQEQVHKWGDANQVQFEKSKESMHILDQTCSFGNDFKMLGVCFDTKLRMHRAIQKLAAEARWRLKSLLRCTKFYDKVSLVRLYKCQVLSIMEGATPAIYHAAKVDLDWLDVVQDSFLEAVGLSKELAMTTFNLAPLSTRRDVDMLTLLHKVRVGGAPACLAGLFPSCSRTLLNYAPAMQPESHKFEDPVDSSSPAVLLRSVFGQIQVYNGLAPKVKETSNLKVFKARLFALVCDAAQGGHHDWEFLLRRKR